ncbi:hypothetical protein KIN20_000079 [Parelaphostrongylus tenuis]|uniref:Uncharacterized protein n=1 Tax=Parelaphostrongylus tenuis TaxID=148309 RepID=A0AAD5MK44_PARTN|nr:hypothetical protein KIN20_000079 [Parelaphostrongylus tenuis]
MGKKVQYDGTSSSAFTTEVQINEYLKNKIDAERERLGIINDVLQQLHEFFTEIYEINADQDLSELEVNQELNDLFRTANQNLTDAACSIYGHIFDPDNILSGSHDTYHYDVEYDSDEDVGMISDSTYRPRHAYFDLSTKRGGRKS